MQEVKNAIDCASNTIEGLYSAVETLIFGESNLIRELIPNFVCYCGISPECNMTKEDYEKIKRVVGGDKINKWLYWYDMEFKIESLADRICAVESLYGDFLTKLPRIKSIDEKIIMCARLDISKRSDDVYIAANNVFVAIAAALDILSKIAYEVSHIGEYNFAEYKRMKSENVLFNRGLPIDAEFKQRGMAFSDMPCISLIEAFRNEYVHNSSWSYRACVYEANDVDGSPLPRFMLFPDYDKRGYFIKSGTRTHFYSQGNKINEKMPDIIVPAIEAIDDTVKSMIGFCYKRASANHGN